MEDYQSLSHTKWNCKYHSVFIPKYRRKRLFGVVRREQGGRLPAAGRTKAMPDRAGAHPARPRPPAHEHPAQAGGVQRRGLPQRQERHPRGAAFPQTRTQLRRAELVGEGISKWTRWAGTPSAFAATSKRRRPRTSASTNSNGQACLTKKADHHPPTQLKTSRFERLTSPSLRLCRRSLTPVYAVKKASVCALPSTDKIDSRCGLC